MNIVVKINNKIKNIFFFGIGPIFRRFIKKRLPSGDKVLIHIGCGEFNDKKYINVDTRPGWHIDYIDSIENCANLFPENYADLIYACHVLEHTSHLKTLKVLKDLFECLKPEGVLRLSVPDFDVIVDMYNERKSVTDIAPPLMGGQGYGGNFHYSIFNEEHLKNLLFQAGFKEVRKWNPENAEFHNFNDWSRRKINLYGKDWQISLNLEGVK